MADDIQTPHVRRRRRSAAVRRRERRQPRRARSALSACASRFRGDAVTLSGTAEQVERAGPVVQGLVDLARMGEPVTPDDVFAWRPKARPASCRAPDRRRQDRAPRAAPRDRPQDAGPARLSPGHQRPRHRGRHRARGHRQDLPRGRQGGGGAGPEAGQADHPRAPGGRGGRDRSASCPATCRPRSIPICVRSTTRSKT